MTTELLDRLETLTRNLRELDGTHHRMGADELFHPAFMAAHTRFATFEEMVDRSGCTVAQEGGPQLIPEDVWERHVQTHTDFSSWAAMQSAGAAEDLAKKAMAGV